MATIKSVVACLLPLSHLRACGGIVYHVRFFACLAGNKPLQLGVPAYGQTYGKCCSMEGNNGLGWLMRPWPPALPPQPLHTARRTYITSRPASAIHPDTSPVVSARRASLAAVARMPTRLILQCSQQLLRCRGGPSSPQLSITQRSTARGKSAAQHRAALSYVQEHNNSLSSTGEHEHPPRQWAALVL